MSNEQDRIRLAEAMYETDGNSLVLGKNRGLMWLTDAEGQAIDGTIRAIPDPYIDANHDYAVLEWMRKKGKKHGVWNYQNTESAMWMRAISASCKFARDYQIGDYARAALKVLDGDES